MPELPEVETIVRDLNKKILNKKIKNVEVRLEKIVKSPVDDFIKIMKNNSFSEIRRRAKLLIFKLSKGDKYLLIHLKMTGQLIYKDKNNIVAGGHGQKNDVNDLPNKYSHVIFHLEDKADLFFNDLRQFGLVKIVDQEGLDTYLSNFGIEPLEKEFSLKAFKELFKNTRCPGGKKTNIKAFLLDQKFVVGIGNIYADETLFESKISPNRRLNTLTDEEIKKLHKVIISILDKAVKARGTTFNNYVDADGNKGGFIKYLKVYQKEGKKCTRCKDVEIKKIKVAGRGTRYCEKCQK